MSTTEMRDDEEARGSAWRPILILLVAGAAAITTIVSCEDTGPSPVGVHPDDSGTEEDTGAKPSEAGKDGSGDSGEEEDAEPSEGGKDAGKDANEVPDAKDAAADG